MKTVKGKAKAKPVRRVPRPRSVRIELLNEQIAKNEVLNKQLDAADERMLQLRKQVDYANYIDQHHLALANQLVHEIEARNAQISHLQRTLNTLQEFVACKLTSAA